MKPGQISIGRGSHAQKPCEDDEDCFEGSGSKDVVTEGDFSSTTSIGSSSADHSSTSTTGGTSTSHHSTVTMTDRSGPGVTYYPGYSSSRGTPSIHSEQHHTTSPIGADTTHPIDSSTTNLHEMTSPEIVSWTPHYPEEGSNEVIDEDEETLPPLFKPPPAINSYPTPTPFSPKSKIRERINSEESEYTAMIIGIVAAALIAVILVILIVLKFKSRQDPSYKVEDEKSFQQGASAALLGNQVQSSQANINYQSANGSGGPQRNVAPLPLPRISSTNGNSSKKSGCRDIKEWYV